MGWPYLGDAGRARIWNVGKLLFFCYELEADRLLFAKTTAGFGINNIAAAVSTSVLLELSPTTAGTSRPYLASRSKMRKRGAESNENASRNYCTIHKH